MNDTRGVSPVIGFALLVGLAAIGSVTLFAVGMSVTSDTQSAIEEQQIEDSMSEFASTTNDLAVGETRSAAFSLARSDDATVTADGEAGNINVTLRLDDDDDLVLIDDQPLGQLEYATRDGPTFTYQGGGIWRQDRHGDPVMVQPPNFEYRSGPREEPTLTFSLVRITDGDRITGGTGSIEVDERRAHYPTGEHSNPMGNGTVEIAVESEYCDAWEANFRQRTSGAINEHCNEGQDGSKAGEEARVIVQLIVPMELFDGVENAAIAIDEIEKSGQAEIKGDEGFVNSLESAGIDERIKDAEEFDDPHDIDEEGVYNFSEINEGIIINTNDGPVDIVVADDIELESSDIVVTGDHEVTFFVNEEVDIGDGSTIGNESNPGQTTLFVEEKVNVRSSNDVIYGIVYTEGKIDVSGNAGIIGAAIGEEISISGGEGEEMIQWDESVGDVTLEEVIASEGQRIYYLHVSETTVTINN